MFGETEVGAAEEQPTRDSRTNGNRAGSAQAHFLVFVLPVFVSNPYFCCHALKNLTISWRYFLDLGFLSARGTSDLSFNG